MELFKFLYSLILKYFFLPGLQRIGVCFHSESVTAACWVVDFCCVCRELILDTEHVGSSLIMLETLLLLCFNLSSDV